MKYEENEWQAPGNLILQELKITKMKNYVRNLDKVMHGFAKV